MPVEQFGQLLVGKIGEWQQETLFAMFAYNFNQVKDRSGTEKYLPLPVNNVFLQVESHRFGDTEIFHGVGDNDPQLPANAEEMVDGSFAIENNRGMVQNIDPLFSEILAGYTFNMTEKSKVDFNVVFFC